MRVLTLSAWYPPQHLGGYEIACASAVDGLRARGHDVMVLSSDFRVPGRDDAPDDDSVPVRRELSLFWEDGVWRRPGLRGAIAATGRDLDVFRRAIADHRPDVLWVWHMAGISKSLLSEAVRMRLPMVLSFLDLWPIYDLSPDPWLRWCRGVRAPVGRRIGARRNYPTRLPDLAADAADAAYCSEWIRGVLAGRGLAPKGRVIYPGLDAHFFGAVTALDRPVRRFLQVGRIEPRKGQAVAVEALAKLHAAGYADTTLSLAGSPEGGHDRELRALADRLGVADAVGFLGSVPPDDLPRVYVEHDAAIHAATWEEPFGLVLIEAMATGRPLICSPTGGAREIVTSDTDALTFPPGDAAALAARMEQLAADPSLAARLVEAGRVTAERFTEDRAAAEHQAMLLAVAGQ